MNRIFLFCLVFFSASTVFSEPSLSSKEIPSIYSGHWWGSLPFKPENEVLLIHDIFIISFNLDKKFPTWLAYKLSPSFVWGQLKAERKYREDPLLPSGSSLTYKDWRGASNCDGQVKQGYDKSHLAPLGSFKSSLSAYQAQYLTNIVPQRRKLNQGPWRLLEEKVRAFVKKGNEVKILTGPLYRKKTAPCWRAAQGKIRELPSHYWKLVSFKDRSKVKVCAFLMPQNIGYRANKVSQYKTSLKKLERETGFSFFKKSPKLLKESCQFLL